MKSCIDFYNDSAQMWADNWYNNDTLMPYLKKFLSYVNKDKPRILDLCCGAGYESMRLKNLGADVVGADLSESSLKIAKEKNPNINFYVKDMLKPYTDLGLFDGVACIAGIVHIAGEELRTALKNMYDVLLDNGYLLLVFREGEGVKQTTEYNNEIYNRNFIYHTRQEVDNLAECYFKFVEDIKSEDDWKYYIYKKID